MLCIPNTVKHVYLLCVFKWLEYVDENVEEVERGPGHEEDDGDGDQHPVGFLPPLHLAGPPVGGEARVGLPGELLTHPAQRGHGTMETMETLPATHLVYMSSTVRLGARYWMVKQRMV